MLEWSHKPPLVRVRLSLPLSKKQMTTALLPHELLNEFLAFHVGRRTDLFGEFYDTLWEPLVQAVSDELSIYLDMTPFARLRVGQVYIREGAERAYLFVQMRDRGGPLNVLGVMSRWGWDVPTYTYELANLVNGRRWNFLDRCLTSVMLPLLTSVADALGNYYQRKPYAKPAAGLIRWLEGVDSTLLCAELDDRSLPTRTGENRSRYLVQ